MRCSNMTALSVSNDITQNIKNLLIVFFTFMVCTDIVTTIYDK